MCDLAVEEVRRVGDLAVEEVVRVDGVLCWTLGEWAVCCVGGWRLGGIEYVGTGG